MTNAELASEFMDYYIAVKSALGDEFETCMAETSAEIISLQSKCKDGTTFATAAMVMSLPDEKDPDDINKPLDLLCKASIVWYLIDQGGSNTL